MSDEPDVDPQPPDDGTAPATAPPIETRFLFVNVASQRAKQLRRGARSRLTAAHAEHAGRRDAPRKPERQAMLEVQSQLVHYRVPDRRVE